MKKTILCDDNEMIIMNTAKNSYKMGKSVQPIPNLGVVKSALQQLQTSVSYQSENDPREYLSLEEWRLFMELQKEIISSQTYFSSDESSIMEKRMVEEMKSKEWYNASMIGEIMSDLGFFGALDRFRFLLQRDRLQDILESLKHSVLIQRMSAVAMHGVEGTSKFSYALTN